MATANDNPELVLLMAEVKRRISTRRPVEDPDMAVDEWGFIVRLGRVTLYLNEQMGNSRLENPVGYTLELLQEGSVKFTHWEGTYELRCEYPDDAENGASIMWADNLE